MAVPGPVGSAGFALVFHRPLDPDSTVWESLFGAVFRSSSVLVAPVTPVPSMYFVRLKLVT